MKMNTYWRIAKDRRRPTTAGRSSVITSPGAADGYLGRSCARDLADGEIGERARAESRLHQLGPSEPARALVMDCFPLTIRKDRGA